MNSLVEYKEILSRESTRLKSKRQQKANEEESMLKEMFRPKINISINDISKNKVFMIKEQDYSPLSKQNFMTFEQNNVDFNKNNYDLEELKNLKEMLEFESSMKKFKEKKDKYEKLMERKHEVHQSQTTINTINQRKLANSKSSKALHDNTGSDGYISSLATSNENMVVKASVEKSNNCKAGNMKHQSLNSSPWERKGARVNYPSAKRKSSNYSKQKHKNAWADYFEKEGIKINDLLP